MNANLQALPFNIALLILSAEDVRNMHEVKVLDIFSSNTKNFHPDGLFSVEAFGKVGEERRNRFYAYIDLNVEVFHPVIYKAIVDLKELYGDILASRKYAIFNPKTKDFEAADISNGRTGFQFFIEHFHQLRFEERESDIRKFLIDMVYRERETCLMKRLIVMPAGLRDYTIAPNGKPEEDEINEIYRRILGTANIVGKHPKQDTHLDQSRFAIQKNVYELYVYITNLLKGKGKMIQGWWAARNIYNTTRNVITSSVSKSQILGDPLTISSNHTVAGLYQTMMAMLPATIHHVKEILSYVFPGPNAAARLVNIKTFEQEEIHVSSDYYDRWMTHDGLEKLMARFEAEALRSEEIIVEGHYLALIYNDGQRVRICHGVQELPEGFNRKHLRPMTYAELFYLAIFQPVRTFFALNTRYPITGLGSIYPSEIYLKTTTKSECLKLLGEDWTETGAWVNEFPIAHVPFINSTSPSSNQLARLGADFDGDTMSFIIVYTKESRNEITKILNSARFYVGTNGDMNYSSSDDISDLVIAEMTY